MRDEYQSSITANVHKALLLASLAMLTLVCVVLIAPQAIAEFTSQELAAMQHAGVAPPLVTQRMEAHSHTGYLLSFARYVVTIAILFGMLQSGLVKSWSHAIRHRFGNDTFVSTAVFVALILLVYSAIRFPFTYYAGYNFPHEYGLSSQSFLDWFLDWGKELAVTILISSGCVWLVLAIVRRFRSRWVFIVWGALSVLIAFAIFLEPLLLEPLFNKFVPLEKGAYRQKIEQISTKAGISDAPIFIVDKSKQTRTINAYVTGLGSSARIVIWDNTLNRLPQEQVLAVVAHETGHYILGHIFWGFLMCSAGLLIVLLAIERWQSRLIALCPKVWGVRALTDIAVIPLFWMALTAVSFAVAPIENGISRVMEHQADEFGLVVTGNGPAMARAFVSLSEENLSNPDPPAFVKLWLFSHPSLRERIDFCLGVKR